MSYLEDIFAKQIRDNGLPEPVREVMLIPNRKFRFDFSWPHLKLAVEIQGGTYMRRGGHSTGGGIERDTEKANLVTLEGYSLLTFTAKQVKDCRAINWLYRWMNERQ